MSFLSSSITSSSQSSLTSPLHHRQVYPSFLPTHATHLLYAAVLDTPHVLVLLEGNKLFEEDSITHELIHLFHGVARAQRLQALGEHNTPLCFALDALPTHILNILYSHGFRTFIEELEPCIIYPIFHRIYLSLPQNQHDAYLERVEQFLLSQPQTRDSTSPVPISPPALATRLSSPPPSETPTIIADDDEAYESPTIPAPTDQTQTIHLPNGMDIISSPTQVIPRPEQIHLTPASSNTICFQCFRNGHYKEDCTEY